ncbi:MAG TPA: tetratricopeptide repeat protein [Pyrinomonadaceae bacterium]|nr:tetratricopeptide repeat protein [Pyrinomonadaceae bacterium]
MKVPNQFLSATLLLVSLCLIARAQAADPVKEAQRLARVAQTAEQQNRPDDAIKAYETIALIARSSPAIAAGALLRAGSIYMSTGRFDKAVNSFRGAIALNPNSAEAQNDLGEALGELKQYQMALRAFQQAVNLDSSFVRARYNMGVTYDRLGQMKYAEFVYRILIREHPDFPLGYDSLAVTLSKSGRAREAIALHQKAISLNPGDPSFYYNAAISYLMLGDVKDALEQKRQVEKLDPAMAEHLAVMIAKRQK